ncbi:MAG: Gfo/Idh/MocA family oxidoreductase [Actinomycetota bacterium]
MTDPDPIRFAVIGLDHPHAYGITLSLLGAGAVHRGFAASDETVGAYPSMFGAERRSDEAILDDPEVDLVVAVGVPSERADTAIATLERGKHALVDKPATTTPEQVAALRDAAGQSDGLFAVYFSERFESRASARASALIADGAIGEIVHVNSFGPHRLGIEGRPGWFFERERNGGILNDLASHQIDQFLHLVGLDDGAIDDVTIASSLVANRAHPDHPELEDYGEVLLRTPTATAMARVDWFSPDGIPTWGDVRLFVVGTDGYVEIRKNIDLGGKPGGDHLLLVTERETRRFDCQRDDLPFMATYLQGLRQGRAAVDPEHCLAVCDLAARAQRDAERHGHLSGGAS